MAAAAQSVRKAFLIASQRSRRTADGPVRALPHAKGTSMKFEEFWPRYLQAHRDPRTRLFHVAGTLAGTALVCAAGAMRKPWLAAAGLAAGYGPAWFSHAFIER